MINTLPRGWAYSYFFGAEEGSEFFPKDKDPFLKRRDFHFRLLNGQGKKWRDYDDKQERNSSKDVVRRQKG